MFWSLEKFRAYSEYVAGDIASWCTDDFARVHRLDGSRMVLAREATAVRETGETEAIRALIAAHHKFGKRLSDMQLALLSQNRKANKRVAGGGKTAKGEAAACLLLVNYCQLVRGNHATQLGEFETEAAVMLPTAQSLADAAEAEGLKAEKKAKASADAEAERKLAERRKKKGKAKKYYAVAVGRSTGIYTDWDEVESYVCAGYSGSVHKSFKSRREAEKWYDKKRRIHRHRRQRRGSPGASSSSSDDGRGSRSRRSRRRHRRSRGRGSSSIRRRAVTGGRYVRRNI